MSHKASNVHWLASPAECTRCRAVITDPVTRRRVTIEDDAFLGTMLLCPACAEELNNWLWKEHEPRDA